jgi:hypothetical protein
VTFAFGTDLRESALELRSQHRVAPLLSLAVGYAGPLIKARVGYGPAGRKRSLKEWVAARHPSALVLNPSSPLPALPRSECAR